MALPNLADPVLVSLLAGGAGAAFLHAALPTHWLPFVLVGRAQGWGGARTLTTAAAAGGAHIATTAAAGAVVLAAGLMLNQWISGLLPWLAGAALFAFGLYYLTKAARGRAPAREGTLPLAAGPGSNRAATLGLIGALAVSPGEALLPLYLGAAGHGPWAFAALTLAFLIGTLGGMLIFTGVARAGVSAFRLERLARYEGAILGLALIALAVFVVINPA